MQGLYNVGTVCNNSHHLSVVAQYVLHTDNCIHNSCESQLSPNGSVNICRLEFDQKVNNVN